MEAYTNELLGYLPVGLVVLFTAAMPIIELKGAIPIGIALGLTPFLSASISFIGSVLPAPFILFGLRPVFEYLKKNPVLRKILDRITEKSMNKSGNIQKYGAYGLFLFVAIPLPGTGVWTGSLIASLLNIRFKWAFTAIFLGNLLAGIFIMGLMGLLWDVVCLLG